MDTAQILADLRAQRDRIDQAIAALEALDGSNGHFRQARSEATTRRHAERTQDAPL